MKRICAVVVSLIVAGTVAWAETEKDIPLSKVPKKVLAAAQKAVAGIKLTEAEVQKTGKGLVYEVEGVADGKKYEINISAAGKVLKVVHEDDDEKEQADDAPPSRN